MAAVTVTSENVAEFAANGGRFPVKTENTPPADTEEKVVEAKPAEEEEHEAEGKKNKKTGIEKRFSELTGERNEAKRAAEEAKKEAAELRARLDKIEKGDADEEPKPEKFTDAVEFGRAYGKWLAAKERQEMQAKLAKERADEEQKKVVSAWNKQWAKVSREYEDFEEVTAEPLVITQQTVTDAIYESDVGPRIAYYLSKNREEAEKINEMGVKAALKYLGRIEAKIELELESAKEKPAEIKGQIIARRQIREAPEPISAVKGVGSTSTGFVDSDGNVTNSKAFRDEMRKKMYGH